MTKSLAALTARPVLARATPRASSRPTPLATPLAVPLAVLLAVLLIAPVQAHGAPEAREIDVRVLADDDGPVAYGEGADQGVPYGGGHDLLALDVREAIDPVTGAPSLVFRLVTQHGDATQGELRDEVSFMADGKPVVLGFATADGTSHTGSGFDRVEGPFAVGDGFPQAIDGWISADALGVGPGDQITDIIVQGHVGEDKADVMPGAYAVAGADVPSTVDTAPGTYTLSGPADYAGLAWDAGASVASNATLTVRLTSPLTALEQSVTLTAAAPEGVTATLASATLALLPGETREVELELSAVPGAAGGTLTLDAVSSLGGQAIGRSSLVTAVTGAGDAGDGAEVGSGDLDPGASYVYTFLAGGAFDYHCHPHPWMEGSIDILPAVNGSTTSTHIIRIVEPGEDPQGWRFEPAELEIHTGDTVVWVNEGEMVHDVRGFNAAAGGSHGDHGDHTGHGDGDHADHGDHGPHGDDAAVQEEADTPMPFLLPALLGALFLRRRRV